MGLTPAALRKRAEAKLSARAAAALRTAAASYDRHAAAYLPAGRHAEFGPLGAPKPGQRGYRPPGYHGRTRDEIALTVVQNARRLLDDPDLATMLQLDPDDADGAMWTAADAADLLGVPSVDSRGQPIADVSRGDAARTAVGLAMHTDPSRVAGAPPELLEEVPAPVFAQGPIPVGIAAGILADRMEPGRMYLVNLPKPQAAAFIQTHHQHLPYLNPRGLMYALGAVYDGKLVAVATAGTPTGQWGSPHGVVELTRVASDGTVKNAASMLVGRLLDLLPVSGRNGEPGRLFVTYQLEGERGAPYRALRDKGLRPVARMAGKAGGGQGARGTVDDALAQAPKIRWEAGPDAGPADWSLLGD